MPLTTYTRTVTLSAAPITVATPAGNPTQLTAGGDVYAVPAAWGARKPQVGDWLVQLPDATLIWWPAITNSALSLNPLAGPFLVGDRVVCPRANPPQVMTVASLAPGGYNCALPTSRLVPFYFDSDLQAAP